MREAMHWLLALNDFLLLNSYVRFYGTHAQNTHGRCLGLWLVPYNSNTLLCGTNLPRMFYCCRVIAVFAWCTLCCSQFAFFWFAIVRFRIVLWIPHLVVCDAEDMQRWRSCGPISPCGCPQWGEYLPYLCVYVCRVGCPISLWQWTSRILP